MGSSSKAKDAKTKKKRGGKVAPPIFRPTLPMTRTGFILCHSRKNVGLMSDCGMFGVSFAEFLSDEINMSYDSFGSDYLRKRYATLLWKYGLNKVKAGYVSDNDDPPRLKSVLNPATENELVNVG
ncbi:hypothetical protein MTR67_001015 [Solanum verrucosum]|uniref:Ulp1 protease family, C-terminal catalytic domain containing protein n=1 Tax=Solanum verrucosum TaxID=315347 RepID=A0AAF0TC06_SOLVR|nr:hypothetical protein MTR67_001015 [Solanum verrucosum]